MIGKFDKKRKEQKALLEELESIKSLLDDGELINDDFSDLAETAIQKTTDIVATQKSELNDDLEDDELIDDGDDDFMISDDLEIDLSTTEFEREEIKIPVLEEMVTEDPSTPLVPGALPGQKSLFEETKQEESLNPDAKLSPAQEIKNNADAIASAISQSGKPKETYSPPTAKSSENPFLPKHIRERLGGNIDVPGYLENNLTYNKSYTSGESTSAQNHSTHSIDHLDAIETNAIIEEVIKEFMPKIENQVREKLALALLKSTNKR